MTKMTMLALDTCFDGCSVALFGADGKTVLASRLEVMQRGHAERLPVMVDEVFAEAGLQPSSLTKVAVTRGPGTFTGIRIGLSYAKGLGLALSIPVIGIDSLLATAIPNKGKPVVVAHVAGGTGLFYSALFDADLNVVAAPALVDQSQVDAWAKGALLIGTASPTKDLPDAARFGAHALALPEAGHAAEPLYLREADAKPNAPVAFSTIITRAATIADAPLLAALHAECFETGWTPEMIASSLALPGAGAIITELANRQYGFVQYQWVAGEAEINTICVLPPYRRQGFAQSLMQALITELRVRHTSKLFLEVAADNTGAIALYRRFGFQDTGVRKAYYTRKSGPAVDAVTMVLAL